MGTISTGNFGNFVPQTGRTPTAQDVSGGLGEAVQRLGATGSVIAGGILDQAEQERVQAAREAKRLLDQETAQAAARAEKVHTLTAHANIQVGLTDEADAITADLSTGKVDKVGAAERWKKNSQKITDDGINNLPPELQPVIRAQMLGLQGQLSNKLTDAFRKRDEQDLSAGLVTYREQQQRFAATDPDLAIKQWGAYVKNFGPAAGWNPEKVEKEMQGFAEQVRYTQAYESVSQARQSRPALDAAEKKVGGLTELDPQKRATLLDRISGYRFALDQKAELQAQRAERQSEATMKRAEAAFNSFQAVADKGFALDPKYIDAVAAQTQGTPYQAGVKALAQQAATSGGLAAQTVKSQRAELDNITSQIAREGNNPTLSKRKDQIEKVLRGSETDIKQDPLRAYLDRSEDATNFTPLDTSSLAGLTKSLTARLPVAARASQWSGAPVAPLTAEEIEPVRKMLDILPVNQRAPAIAALATALGPQASAGLSRQIGKTDRALELSFGMAGAQTTQGRQVSELVLRGAQAQKDGTSTKNAEKADVKSGEWKRFMTTEAAGLYESQTLTEGVRDAAVYIAHGIASEQGGKLNEEDMQRAFRLAAGGEVVEFNGRRIPLPAGVDTDMLSKRLNAIAPTDINAQTSGGKVRAAGVEVPVETFVRALPGAELSYAGPGRFNVLVNGRPVTSADGKRRITIGVQ